MSQQKKAIKLYSPEFYGYCGIGGILSCGLTHTLVTPIDLVKCRMQTGYKYRSFFHGFREIAKESGVRGVFRGWAPTLVGYSFQGISKKNYKNVILYLGLCKFGFYEYFKKTYGDIAGENFEKYRTVCISF